MHPVATRRITPAVLLAALDDLHRGTRRPPPLVRRLVDALTARGRSIEVASCEEPPGAPARGRGRTR